jgi:hypothetical protein
MCILILFCCFVDNPCVTCITESVRTVLDFTFCCLEKVVAFYVTKVQIFFKSSINLFFVRSTIQLLHLYLVKVGEFRYVCLCIVGVV